MESPSGHGWEKTKLNTVVRYRNRGKYDYETVHSIIDQCPLLHVSFSAAECHPDAGGPSYPVILPMLGCTGRYRPATSPPQSDEDEDGSRYIYLHGYVSSRFFRSASSATKISDSEEGPGVADSVPVCISATLLDGIVLALTPNHSSANYRSAVAFGHATIVHDEKERLYAMELITNNLVPGRWRSTRYPSSAELKATGIVRVKVDSASAKVRTGTTGEARSDLQDERMRKQVWAGVVPVHTVFGEPVAAPTNLYPGTPTYIDEWRNEVTEEARRYAYESSEK